MIPRTNHLPELTRTSSAGAGRSASPRNKLWVYLSSMLVVLLFGSALASAQLESGQVAGTVSDQSGAVIAGATVAVKNLANGAERSTHTSATGAYNFPGLLPGTYKITATSGNFQPFSAKVEVTVGGHSTLDVKLSVSASVTEVQVVGEGGAQVNTQTQEISDVVDTQQLAQLPSLTRNPYDFVALSGNVSNGDSTGNSGNSGQNLTSRGVGFSINGQRETGTEILLDGVENVAIFSYGIGQDIPVDSVQEYSVITNNFSAEYGRASGGVVNVTTKAGTNAIHGSAWGYNRLSAYTANTYGNDAQNAAAGSIVAPKGKYTRNQFGFAAGGPIKKDKIFLFESTEWTRVRSNASETEEVFDPSFIKLMPQNIQNYFNSFGQTKLTSSSVASTVADIANTCAFNSPAPTTCVNPTPFPQLNNTTTLAPGQAVFDTVNFTAPFDAGGGEPVNQYTTVGRIDYNPTDKTQMYFRGGRESIVNPIGATFYSAYPQYNAGNEQLNQSYLYSASHTFTQNVFLSAKASFTRYNSATTFDQTLLDTPSLMFTGNTDPNTGALIQMPGLENQSEPGEGGLPAGGPQNTIQLAPDLAWTKGKHSMRFGATYTYIQMNYAYGAYIQAVEQLGPTFSGSMENFVNSAGNPNGSPLVGFSARIDPQGKLPCSVDQYGNLLTEPSCEVQPPLQAPNIARSYRYNDWAIYGQDSYRATPQLTLNAGLRWEHYGIQHNNNQSLDSNFYLGSGSGIEEQTANGQVYTTQKSPIGSFWKPTWGTVAPRVGFAYDLFGNGRDSIRGGYGISYERNFGNVTYNASFNPPASGIPNFPYPVGDTSPNAQVVTNNDLGALGLPSTTGVGLPPLELRFINDQIHTSQTQFWSLAFQHQLFPGTVLEIGYSGAKGTHLYDLANVNQVGAAQVYLGAPLLTGDQCNTAQYATGIQNEITGDYECLTRPNAQYANINMRGSGGGSSYNGLNAKFQTQDLRHTGLSLGANYTWSHSLDELSSTFGDSLQGGSGYVGSLGYTSLIDPSLDWGSSDFDVRQRLSVAPIWNTPWFKHTDNSLEKQTLGGWTLSGIYTARGGTPFSVYDYTFDETYYTVPRLEPATPFSSYSVARNPKMVGPNQFNGLNVPASAATEPYNTTLGISDFGPFPSDMMRRNSLRGPGAWNIDAAAHKTFPITERVGLEFSAEGINVLNHHNFYVNPTTLSGPGGFVLEQRGGLGSLATGGNHDERRFGQFALKVNF